MQLLLFESTTGPDQEGGFPHRMEWPYRHGIHVADDDCNVESVVDGGNVCSVS